MKNGYRAVVGRSMKKYRALNAEVKCKLGEAKKNANDRWGQEFGRAFEESKKKFWKELKRIRKGGSRNEEM